MSTTPTNFIDQSLHIVVIGDSKITGRTLKGLLSRRNGRGRGIAYQNLPVGPLYKQQLVALFQAQFSSDLIGHRNLPVSGNFSKIHGSHR